MLIVSKAIKVHTWVVIYKYQMYIFILVGISNVLIVTKRKRITL